MPPLPVAVPPIDSENPLVPTDFLSIFKTLEDAEVRYVVVGGLALVLHGVDRLTADVDLVIDLGPEQAAKAMRALTEAGFRPSLPVDAIEFADAATRAAWRRDRGMVVFSLWDPSGNRPTIDLFTEAPMDFERLWAASEAVVLSGQTVRLVALADLINMKRSSARPRDREDIARLELLLRDRRGET